MLKSGLARPKCAAPKLRRRPLLEPRRPAARRFLGRKIEGCSISQLREHVDSYLRLTRAVETNPGDALLEKKFGRAADALIGTQTLLVQDGIAKRAEDGSIITDLADGRELVAWVFECREPADDRRVEAEAWLAKRKPGASMKILSDELLVAMEDGSWFPNDFFGALVSRVLVRDRSKERKAGETNLLQEMREAVANLERDELNPLTCQDERAARREERRVLHRIVDILLRQLHDQSPMVTEQKDGSLWSDLGDGREIGLQMYLRSKAPKSHRARALSWLKERGKTHQEDLPNELRAAVAEGNYPLDLLDAMTQLQFAIRRKV
jgi:hypothetical protein